MGNASSNHACENCSIEDDVIKSTQMDKIQETDLGTNATIVDSVLMSTVFPENKQAVIHLLTPIEMDLLSTGYLRKYYRINPSDLASVLLNYIGNNTIIFHDPDGNHSNEYTVLFKYNYRDIKKFQNLSNSNPNGNGNSNLHPRILTDNEMIYLVNDHVQYWRFDPKTVENFKRFQQQSDDEKNVNQVVIPDSLFKLFNIRIKLTATDCNSEYFNNGGYFFRVGIVQVSKKIHVKEDTSNCNNDNNELKIENTINTIKENDDIENQNNFFQFIDKARKDNFCNFAKLAIASTGGECGEISTKYLTFDYKAYKGNVTYSCYFGFDRNEEMSTIYDSSDKKFRVENETSKLNKGDSIDITINKSDVNHQFWFNFVKTDRLDLRLADNVSKNVSEPQGQEKENEKEKESNTRGVPLLSIQNIQRGELLMDLDKYDYYYALQCNNCSCKNKSGFMFDVQLA